MSQTSKEHTADQALHERIECFKKAFMADPSWQPIAIAFVQSGVDEETSKQLTSSFHLLRTARRFLDLWPTRPSGTWNEVLALTSQADPLESATKLRELLSTKIQDRIFSELLESSRRAAEVLCRQPTMGTGPTETFSGELSPGALEKFCMNYTADAWRLVLTHPDKDHLAGLLELKLTPRGPATQGGGPSEPAPKEGQFDSDPDRKLPLTKSTVLTRLAALKGASALHVLTETDKLKAEIRVALAANNKQKRQVAAP